MPDTAPAPIGHNNPLETPDDLRNRLRAENSDLLERQKELLQALERIPATIDDDQTAQKLTQQISIIKACVKKSEDRRKVAKNPYLERSRTVDQTFKSISDPLNAAAKDLTGRLNNYQRRKLEIERRSRAEAERKAREEAEAAAKLARTEADLEEAIKAEERAKQAAEAAEASTAEMGRTRGEYGAVASARTVWTGQITDPRILDLEALRPHLPLTALQQAVRAFVKAGGRDLKGARIFEDIQTAVR